MLEAAHEAMSFAQGQTRVSLDRDRQLALALVKEIEIVGEAANQVSKQTRLEVPEMPWERIIGMRNRLEHAYFDINLDIVWNTVQVDLPNLTSLLENVISSRSVWLPETEN